MKKKSLSREEASELLSEFIAETLSLQKKMLTLLFKSNDESCRAKEEKRLSRAAQVRHANSRATRVEYIG